MERLIRAVDRVLSTYREHWRAGEDVIVEVEAQELAVARDEIGIPE